MHPFPPYPPSHSHFPPYQPPYGSQGAFRMPHQSMQAHQDPLNRLFGAIGTGGIPARTSVFSMLDNVQKVLKVAETMGPMVKQYGPMMRNLPSVLTMIKDYQTNTASKNETAGSEGTEQTANKAEAVSETVAPAEPAQEAASEKVVISGPAAKSKGQKKGKAPVETAPVLAEENKAGEEPGEVPSFKKNKLSLSGQSQSLFKKKKNEDAPVNSPVSHELPNKNVAPPASNAEADSILAGIPIVKRKKSAKKENAVKTVPSSPKKTAQNGASQPKLYI